MTPTITALEPSPDRDWRVTCEFAGRLKEWASLTTFVSFAEMKVPAHRALHTFGQTATENPACRWFDLAPGHHFSFSRLRIVRPAQFVFTGASQGFRDAARVRYCRPMILRAMTDY